MFSDKALILLYNVKYIKRHVTTVLGSQGNIVFPCCHYIIAPAVSTYIFDKGKVIRMYMYVPDIELCIYFSTS